MRRAFPALLLTLLAGCAAPPADVASAEVNVLLLGEQHDAAEHQQLQRQAVEALAGRGVLAALALEMAEQGAGTAGLPATAGEAQVREALRWNERGWPWAAYGPAVMAAVAAGVPVVGANLPRERMRAAMTDAPLDALLAPPALARQREAIREGHCNTLPDAQIAPMARIQIARDRAMAETVSHLAVPGKTVVLVAGAGHVDPALGVPVHLPKRLSFKAVVLPAVETGKDYCAQLRK